MKKAQYKKADDIISIYSREDGIADGLLIEIFKNRWQQLSGGRPILAISHLYNEISLAGLMEIWNEFVDWDTNCKSQDSAGDFCTILRANRGALCPKIRGLLGLQGHSGSN